MSLKQQSIKVITVSSTLSLSDMGVIICNSASAIEVTLPLATDNTGLWYKVLNMSTGDVSIIGASVTPPVVLQGNSKFIVSDGTNWIITPQTITGKANQIAVVNTADQTEIGFVTAPTFTAAKFGDTSNYSEFETDGTLKFIGTATTWQDVDFPIIIRTTGTSIPSLTTLQGNVTVPSWAVNDYNVCEGQELVHQWKEGSEVRWHVHMITNGVDVTDSFVKWEIEYCWCNINGVLSASTTEAYEYTIPANTASKTMLLVPISNWTPVGGMIGGHVYARLKRIASTGSAPTNNPWCGMLQLHIECDTVGSRTNSAK